MQYQTESDQTDDATIVQAFAVYTSVTGLTYPNICSVVIVVLRVFISASWVTAVEPTRAGLSV